MTEFGIGTAASLSLGGMAFGSWLWMWGGRSDKIIRRLGAPAVMTLVVNLASLFLGVWVWGLILVLPTGFAGASMGYGGVTTGHKVVRRTLFAVGNLMSALVILWAFGFPAAGWLLFWLHTFISTGTVMFAIKNPIHAAAEEVFVFFLLWGPICFYPFLA